MSEWCRLSMCRYPECDGMDCTCSAGEWVKEVVLVSHGFFNHYLTGDVNDKGEQTTPWWEETELRTFSFVEGDKRAMIRETDESMRRRGAKEEGPRLNRPKERGKSISV